MTFRSQKTPDELSRIALKSWDTRRKNAAKPQPRPPAPVKNPQFTPADLWGREIAAALNQSNGDKIRAARALGIPVSRLDKRIAEYGLHDLVRQHPKRAPGSKAPEQPKPSQDGVELLRSVVQEMVRDELNAIFGLQTAPKTKKATANTRRKQAASHPSLRLAKTS